jgi:hypothetical protein
LLLPRGFIALPRRWVVERTFAWLSHNRHMSKDYERLCATSEAFVYAAMTRLMVRRLVRAYCGLQCGWAIHCISDAQRLLGRVFAERSYVFMVRLGQCHRNLL